MGYRALLSVCLLGLAMVLNTGAASAQAFDLKCGDTLYRVDLKSKTWCEDDCDQILTLRYRGRDWVALWEQAHFSSTYHKQSRVMTSESCGVDGPCTTYREHCRVRRFSGFPPKTEAVPSR